MFFKYDNENIKYIGRWAPLYGAATATAPGSHFTLAFKGRNAVLCFDTKYNMTPMPHLWLSVDGGARIETELSPFIRISANGEGPHTAEVILKSMVEVYPRWNLPLDNKLSFLGIEAEELLESPATNKKTIEFVGDSITEGVLTDPDCAPWPINELKVHWRRDQRNRPWQDDVTATYAWQAAELLGLEPIMMGYGAVGTGKGGCGEVPSAPEAYPYCFEGAPISFPHPDYVFINHGTNDRGNSSEIFKKNYTALIEAIYTAHPSTQLICMIPFIGAHKEDIIDIVELYNTRKGKDIILVDASEWLPPDPLHPVRASHRLAGEKIARLLADKI